MLLAEISPPQPSTEAQRQVRQDDRKVLLDLQQNFFQHQPARQNCPQEN